MRRTVRAGLTLTAVGIVAGAGFLTPVAASAATPAVAVGDVTGDGLADRVTLSSTTAGDGTLTCLARVQAGTRKGGYAPAVDVVLDVPDNAQADPDGQQCPDTPLVMTARRPAQNRLLALYVRSSPTGRGANLYDLTGKTLRRGTAPRLTTVGTGLYGAFGTVDLDGDGVQDLWTEGSDQGESSLLYQRRGDTFVQVFRSAAPLQYPAPGTGFQFVDLNHRGGTDALYSTASSLGTNTAQAIDGRTGAVVTLASIATETDPDVYGYAMATVDLDHDGYPDIQVQPLSDTGTNPAPRYFRNASQGGRWQFTAVPPART